MARTSGSKSRARPRRFAPNRHRILAMGHIRVIVADPPWPYEIRKPDPSHRATHPYPQMSIADICAEASKVDAIAPLIASLWLWDNQPSHARGVCRARPWSFTQKTILTWVKDRMGTGDWLRGQTEHCLMAVRGRPVVELTNQTTVLHGPMRAHSQKPDEFYTLVERLCPAPRYAYLFSRNARDGWDAHGDEAKQHVEVAP